MIITYCSKRQQTDAATPTPLAHRSHSCMRAVALGHDTPVLQQFVSNKCIAPWLRSNGYVVCTSPLNCHKDCSDVLYHNAYCVYTDSLIAYMVSVMSLLDMLKCAQHEHHHNDSAGVVRRRAIEHGLATTDDPQKYMQVIMDINSAKFQHTLAKVMLTNGTSSLEEAKRIAASHLGFIYDSGSDMLCPHIKINFVDAVSEGLFHDMAQAIGESRRSPMRACRVRTVSTRAGGAGPSSEIDLGTGVRPSDPNGIGNGR